MIGKLKRVKLREVWKHEAVDFTRWLEENIDVLAEVIDLDLSGATREKTVGKLSVDLVAEDDSGNPVVIENQLEKSNHEHLGKIITYLTGIEAKAAVWIVSDPRPEHVKAISWLNESSTATFYLVKVEAVTISESPPAPLLTLIVGPSEETGGILETKKDLAERHKLRLKFWTTLLDRAKGRTKLHSAISPSRENWVGTGAGKSGLTYNYVINQHDGRVELYIDRGRELDSENKAIFERLAKSKSDIEKIFGEPLEWQSLEGRRACRVKMDLMVGGYKDSEEKWPKIQDAMIDAMIRLDKAFKPHIAKLKS